MKVGILGSGALGLTAAYRSLEKGHQVTVIEKEKEVGGLLTSLKVGESYFEKFYHHIFGTDQEIISLIEDLGLGAKLVWKPGKTGTYYQGKIYPLDSPLTVLTFSPLSLVSRLRLGLCLAYLKFTKNYEKFETVTATQWLKKWMGEETYKIIWEPLLRGKFADNFEQITMSWFWARVFARTSKLGYLRGGFFQLYQALGKKVKEAGGEIILGEGVESITQEGEKVRVKTDRGNYLFDKVICTLPTNLFFKLTPTLPPAYKEKYHWDDYFGAQTLVLTLTKPITDYYWLNISNVC